MNVLFFGTPDFAVPGLQAILGIEGVKVIGVVTQPDKPTGRGGTVTPSPIKKVALDHQIPVLQPTSIRKELETFLANVAALGPCDIGVVIAFGQILPLQVLHYPKAHCVNVHASLLPRWRGAAPIHRALLAGDSSTGVCLMDMEAGLDTGGVYSSATTPIHENDTVGSLHDRLAQLGANLLTTDLAKIARGELTPIPQPSEGVTYASKITPQEARIDWSLPSTVIERTVRGFFPFPGAYTSWQGKRMKVLEGCVSSPTTPTDSTPGEILSAASDRFEIATGQGVYQITSLQPEGKRRMSVAEFLNGNVIVTGARLGE